jgi:hypothetical protein
LPQRRIGLLDLLLQAGTPNRKIVVIFSWPAAFCSQRSYLRISRLPKVQHNNFYQHPNPTAFHGSKGFTNAG